MQYMASCSWCVKILQLEYILKQLKCIHFYSHHLDFDNYLFCSLIFISYFITGVNVTTIRHRLNTKSSSYPKWPHFQAWNELLSLIYWFKYFNILHFFPFRSNNIISFNWEPIFLNSYSNNIKYFLFHFYFINQLSLYDLQSISSMVLYLYVNFMYSF